MNLHEQIVNGKGYAVLPIENIKNFSKLKDLFMDKMRAFTEEKKIEKVRLVMSSMTKSQINELMVSLLSFDRASEILAESCKNIVKELSGEEIFLQRRANTIFNLPNKNHRRQWPHYELMSGISPFTYGLWAPLHDLDDNDGVFYKDLDQSYDLIKEEKKYGVVNGPIILNKKYEEKPIKLKYGEVIVFSPFVLHGNVGFESKLTRIATSARFQSIKKPLFQKDSDFFKFYKI